MHERVARPRIGIAIARFWSGATAGEIIGTLLPDLDPYFQIEVSASPDALLYGPYPGEVPRGPFVKVFVGCENVFPIMRECDWAFGVMHEEVVGHPRYMRIARWGDDSALIARDKDWPSVLAAKTGFCAFLYAN